MSTKSRRPAQVQAELDRTTARAGELSTKLAQARDRIKELREELKGAKAREKEKGAGKKPATATTTATAATA